MERTHTSLRRGWTTGSCATAAARAAWCGLCGGAFPDPVTIILPGGQHVAFALAAHGHDGDGAWAEVVKDAGDDPDVTHGAHVRVDVRRGPPGSGVVFRAGEGVGTVTLPGLPVPPGEPAINPVPRRMIRTALRDVAGREPDVVVTVSVAGGQDMARHTLNGRLGIVGGLSILGTTGIVVPFSCAAWIDSIHRGVDVARALGLPHVAGCTGDVSERATRALYDLPEEAMLEMGDFAGGLLKYLRRHPVGRVTIGGGVAKMTKLAQGFLDLHSRRGQADMTRLAALAQGMGGPDPLVEDIARSHSVAAAFALAAGAGYPLGPAVAHGAWQAAADVLAGNDCVLDVLLFDRAGTLVARHGPHPVRG
ncbi:cobalt-precorrin-5B (C(1))-methyltransferase [Komagataeibacter oboediens]|uniref:Cobalt-precorrin-5B C(1)-methyltransferase n=1 Tax=Komagataeibacter oboediens TaxID=65958 RepID=A0ABS5SJ47_9PROT|nr:cobalt-precorrin-5B (C(1))-methyltransferase [Komagataeibacter oboediens]MBL7232929.1 cobalt-precorrin-5B (C(1))-methyltransferase [Komagataeibacter oboediens]MBT0674253.1 cobalt-precorrin-5B (C(1))-methyltransferase [Komagataeibacter oboediens]MBT0679414.1 cobalt-precorrin-5B (C(1))-methyltransferase [Komagataeibacter oboediens]